MASFSRFLQRLFRNPNRALLHPVGPDLSRFAEGDRVLVDGKKLSGPLHANHRLELPRGYIAHNDIIGKTPRAFVSTNVGQKYQITHPNLDQYIALTPRKVTPVYASYASLIVSLLDINVAAPTTTNENDPPFEILEAGTGHGALTLHLARAIHAANPPPPSLPPHRLDLVSPVTTARPHDATPDETDEEKRTRTAWETYRASRRAMIHSVEISPVYSAHAQKLIYQFRRGMYAPHVDFHVASIGDWIQSRLNTPTHASSFLRFATGTEPFLSHAILDMPACHLHIEAVACAMKDGALLVVFVPSVTQIGDCVRTIQDQRVKLQMEQVIELGEGISNGRVWDVRLAQKRARPNQAQTMDEEKSGEIDPETGAQVVTRNDQGEFGNAEVKGGRDDDSVMVCRPKVGRMTIGGGFIGLWRKMDSLT